MLKQRYKIKKVGLSLYLVFINSIVVRYTTGSTTTHFCWKATRRWPDPLRLQHPKGVDTSFGVKIEGRR